MKSLGFAINIAIMHGLYLLDLTIASVLIGVAALLFYGLEFLVPGVNKQRVKINPTTEYQELLFWMLPIYPVLSRLHHNYIEFQADGPKLDPNKVSESKLKSFSFGIDITSIFYVSIIIFLVVPEILGLYLFFAFIYIYALHFKKDNLFLMTIRDDFHLIKHCRVIIRDDNIVRILWNKGFLDILNLFIYIFKEILESIFSIVSSDYAGYKIYKTEVENPSGIDSVTTRVDCGSCEMIISNYNSVTNVKGLVNHVEKIMKDDNLSFLEKSDNLDEYCRNKTYSIEVNHEKLVFVRGMP